MEEDESWQTEDPWTLQTEKARWKHGITRTWAQCDLCERWRRLPLGWSAPAEDAAASAADIERLNKLFGMGDAEK